MGYINGCKITQDGILVDTGVLGIHQVEVVAYHSKSNKSVITIMMKIRKQR